jgi:hypothetical protein
MGDEENNSTGNRSSTGGQTALERIVDRHLGNAIHLFLSLLAFLILIAALGAAFDTVVRDFPKLWQPTSEYNSLQQIIENILLIAIAAELGLLLLFHRAAAAVEVVIFIIARKMVTPGIPALDVLLGSAALSGLIIVRYYYLSGRNKPTSAE